MQVRSNRQKLLQSGLNVLQKKWRMENLELVGIWGGHLQVMRITLRSVALRVWRQLRIPMTLSPIAIVQITESQVVQSWQVIALRSRKNAGQKKEGMFFPTWDRHYQFH